MKINHILCFCAAIGLSQPAWAELQLTGQSLGTSQATVDFCAQIDPSTAAKYQDQMVLMEQSVPGDELAKIRSTDEYKETYARTSATLGEIAKPEAAEACNRFLDMDKQTEKEADRQATKEVDRQDKPVEHADERTRGTDVDHL